VIVFSGAKLDRAAALRRRPDWLEAQRADPAARAVLMSERGIWLAGDRLLLRPPSAGAVFLVTGRKVVGWTSVAYAAAPAHQDVVTAYFFPAHSGEWACSA
jgi:hypothetical protein